MAVFTLTVTWPLSGIVAQGPQDYTSLRVDVAAACQKRCGEAGGGSSNRLLRCFVLNGCAILNTDQDGLLKMPTS